MPDSIPSGWKQYCVNDLISYHASGPSPTCDERQIRDQEWGLLKTTAITWSGWDATAHKTLPPHYWNQLALEVHNDDVLVTKAGPRHRVGVVVHVNDNPPPHLIVSGKMVLLRPRNQLVLPRILASALALKDPQDFLNERTSGMAESQVNFTNSTLLRTPLTLPSIVEQRRILEILDAIDKQVERTRDVILRLQLLLQGIKIDLADPQPDHAPKDWKVAPLGEFIRLQRGFDITVAEQRDGDIPVVSSSGTTSYHDTAIVAGPGVVTGRKGKLGHVYYLEESFWPHDTSLWVKEFGSNEPKFVALLLSMLRLERLDAATSVPTLNRNAVHPMIVAVPNPTEQRRIVKVVESMEERIRSERAELSKIEALRTGLIEDLLTGRVRV
ncbi:restriction endonuclease subunit S [Embleya sp. NPDC127516]|uniref:restriction endonuclease subunit S n=1 Tax=Embleya sp. NPDC127516 TaxID=3363990 RepID=UPI0037FCA263